MCFHRRDRKSVRTNCYYRLLLSVKVKCVPTLGLSFSNKYSTTETAVGKNAEESPTLPDPSAVVYMKKRSIFLYITVEPIKFP